MNSHFGPSGKAIKKALAHQEAGRLRDAERLFRSVRSRSRIIQSPITALAFFPSSKARMLAAIPFLNAAVNANPREPHYWFSFAEALIEAGAIGDARSVLEKGGSFGLSGPPLAALLTRLKNREFYQLALQHHRAGRLAEAEQGYTEILSVDPAHVHSLHKLGVVATQTNRLEVAVALIGEAIRLKGTVAVSRWRSPAMRSTGLATLMKQSSPSTKRCGSIRMTSTRTTIWGTRFSMKASWMWHARILSVRSRSTPITRCPTTIWATFIA